MNPNDLGKYIAATDSASQPWLLVQLRLSKLMAEKEHLSSEAYLARLKNIHQDFMELGEWWHGREAELFGE